MKVLNLLTLFILSLFLVLPSSAKQVPWVEANGEIFLPEGGLILPVILTDPVQGKVPNEFLYHIRPAVDSAYVRIVEDVTEAPFEWSFGDTFGVWLNRRSTLEISVYRNRVIGIEYQNTGDHRRPVRRYEGQLILNGTVLTGLVMPLGSPYELPDDIPRMPFWITLESSDTAVLPDRIDLNKVSVRTLERLGLDSGHARELIRNRLRRKRFADLAEPLSFTFLRPEERRLLIERGYVE